MMTKGLCDIYGQSNLLAEMQLYWFYDKLSENCFCHISVSLPLNNDLYSNDSIG